MLVYGALLIDVAVLSITALSKSISFSSGGSLALEQTLFIELLNS